MTRKLWIGIVCAIALAIPIFFFIGLSGRDRAIPPDPLREETEPFQIKDALLTPAREEKLPEVPQEQLPEPEETPPPEIPPEEQPPEPEEVPPEETEEENVPEAESAPEEGEAPAEEPSPGGDGSEAGEIPGNGEAEGGEAGGSPGTGETEGSDPVLPVPADDPKPGSEEDPEPTPVPDDEKPLAIWTDLRTQTITAEEGDGETYLLRFSAEIENGEPDMELCVFFRSVSPTGELLDSGELPGDGEYAMELQEGTHTFTFRIRQDGSLLSAPQETRVVTWSTNKNPPVISAMLGNISLSDGCTVETDTQEPLLKVSATDYTGKRVPLSGLTVWLDGVEQVNYTGSAVKEYKLWLSPPEEGDEALHEITVQARDAQGQTAEESYTVAFRPIPEGEIIGTATVYFDCTTVGLDLLDPYGLEVEIRQGYPASFVLMDCLTEYGWDCTYSGGLGGPDDPIGGFYLKSIIGPDFSYANPKRLVPELWNCILNDGLEIDPSLKPNGALSHGDELGEFDFTADSGWMYEVNGYYPGRGLSDYYLQDGDVLTLRFTLALGKDVGQSAGSKGRFSSYCRTWVNGAVWPAEHPEDWFEVEEIPATCTEDGERSCTCPCCGETKSEPIPATGHEYEYEILTEPTCTDAGVRHGICTRCGEETDEELPPSGHAEETVDETPPDCEHPGTVHLRCTVCGAEREETIPALGHDYVDGFCTRCGAEDPDRMLPPPPGGDEDDEDEDEEETP